MSKDSNPAVPTKFIFGISNLKARLIAGFFVLRIQSI
jgi:hypothetical protein